MSLSHRTAAYEMAAEDRDRKAQGYGFILALVGFALTLLVLSAIFTPVAIGSGVGNELFVGP